VLYESGANSIKKKEINYMASAGKEMIRSELLIIIEKIENTTGIDSGLATKVLDYLNQLLAESEKQEFFKTTVEIYSALRIFWLESIPWCSELSRDIEKLIMMYDELRE
jgi:hypothetical protein